MQRRQVLHLAAHVGLAGAATFMLQRAHALPSYTVTAEQMREALAKQGVVPAGGSAERLQQLVTQDIARWTRLVATAQIKTE